MKLFKKKIKEPVLPEAHAEQILGEVFDSCGFKHNTVPLEALLSYANYRKEKYTLQRAAIITVLALFLFLPLLFISAEIIIAVQLEKNSSNPVFGVTVSPFIPVDSISVMMNGRTVPVYQVDSHEFIIRPIDNGDMTVSVTLINKQVSSEEYAVSGIDVTAPSLVSVDTDGNQVTVILADPDSGLDGESISLTYDDGTSLDFVFAEETGAVIFSYPEETVTLKISDTKGNPLTVQMKP